MKQSKLIDLMMPSVYKGPAQQYLMDNAPDFLLIGEIRITEFVLRLSENKEREFIALLSAEVKYTLSEMASLLRAPTLPVHDEPMPEELASP